MKTIAKDFRGSAGTFKYIFGNSYTVISENGSLHSVEAFISESGKTKEESLANARLFAGSKRMVERLENAHKILHDYSIELWERGIGFGEQARAMEKEAKEIETLLEEIL